MNPIRPQGSFKDAMKPFHKELALVQKETDHFIQEHFGDSESDLQEAFILFGQGTLWDKRRLKQEYDFKTKHSMDSTASYYVWYSFNHSHSVVNNVEDGGLLNLARRLALAGAVQTEMKPQGVGGPIHKDPHYKPIPQLRWMN